MGRKIGRNMGRKTLNRFWILGLLVGLSLQLGCQDKSSDLSGAMTAIEETDVKYRVGDQEMVGFLAKPTTASPSRGAVLVVHEWWGQTSYPRKRARMLAKLGYVAFAVDMYGERKTADHPKKAGSFAKAVLSDAKTARKSFDAAIEALLAVEPQIAPQKIAAIGYCFGGSVVLEMARQGKDLAGVVSFHGGLNTPSKARVGVVKAPMLVLNGAADTFIKQVDIQNLKAEMRQAQADLRFINYKDAVHGFTNPGANSYGDKFGIPLAYNKDADRKSWQEMQKFLEEIL